MKSEQEIRANIKLMQDEAAKLNDKDMRQYLEKRELKSKISTLSWAVQ